MPYIKEEWRSHFDKDIDRIVDMVKHYPMNVQDGCVNYVITSILARVYDTPGYFEYNRARGVISCVKDEHYRRVVAPYEDKKREENGDVY